MWQTQNLEAKREEYTQKGWQYSHPFLPYRGHYYLGFLILFS